MEERHLHFNLLMALFVWVVFVVVHNAMKFLLNKYQVPGLTDLVNNV